jgi:hypothetical protein
MVFAAGQPSQLQIVTAVSSLELRIDTTVVYLQLVFAAQGSRGMLQADQINLA